MRYEVTPTEKGKVLVDGSAEIKEDEICYDKVLNITFKTDHTTNYDYVNKSDLVYKIIASINHSISLDVAMVVIEDEGWESSWEITNSQIKNGVNPHAYRLGWLGKSAQQKGVYSQKDLINLARYVCDVYRNPTDRTIGAKLVDEYIQSLNQEYIELEMISDTTEIDNCKRFDKEIGCALEKCKCESSDLLRIKTNRVNGQLIAYVKK